MALADDTKRVVDQFEFTDADVNAHVQEFLKQMSEFSTRNTKNLRGLGSVVIGLAC